ncbi:4'-phosphopantetheinyl transferase family protein [Paraeggerthella hongkongensis]|uniref:4'-phosphopantetheinyl transferase domain-containing protein n=1 Tax=Paraeggerthella hongkongensis TaxID=230658 RepID=A0A3N0BKS8_9ACTN|nr:4'-phosphopantetheinyl transferase superfamily protein [Paraeggerthella hongkongensis]RNL49030.1 hypothetical protein DMP08_00820 [Paraeggerthella hongkongensis]
MDLYLASVPAADERSLVEAALPFATPAKRVRMERCRVAQQRAGMALVEVLLAWALCEKRGVDLRAVDRFEDDNGKPFVRYVGGSVEFSVSHSGSYALVGIDDAPIGVDIQQQRQADERLARKVMDAASFETWLGSSDGTTLFCDYWARMESELKWWGVGIAGLGRADLVLPEGVSACAVDVPAGYSASVCAALPKPAPVRAFPRIVQIEELLAFAEREGLQS